MASRTVTIDNFDSRLWLTGGRDQIPPGSLRRAVGVAPELTRSVRSRWGSALLSPINAISLYEWEGVVYSYDGAHLYANGVPVVLPAGSPNGGLFNGGRLTFVSMPPQTGDPDYLFVLGGGQLFKIAPPSTINFPIPAIQQVTNWGIAAPPNGMQGQVGVQEVLTIDDFEEDWSQVAMGDVWGPAMPPPVGWTPNGNLTLSKQTEDAFSDTSYLRVGVPQSYSPPGDVGLWGITRPLTLDLSQYADGTISLPTDLISIYAKFGPSYVTAGTGFFSLEFDVNDGSFKKDRYIANIQLVANSANLPIANAALIKIPQGGDWVQFAVAKNAFSRIGGTALQFDWSNVQAVRIRGGIGGNINATGYNIDFQLLQLVGGSPIGQGPYATSGGATVKYAVTFGNSTTGSDSNPNGMVTQPDGTVSPFVPVAVQNVAEQPVVLNNIPVSPDPQVSNRKLWRTAEDLGLFFYLDIIPDNTTTTYIDTKSSIPGQPIIQTPWTPNFAVPALPAPPLTGYKIDAGNGFWFKVTAIAGSGTTGANPPAWSIPSGPFLGDWSPIDTYPMNAWVFYQGVGYVALQENTAVPPTAGAPSWQVVPVTIDNPGANQVTWTLGGLNAVPALGPNALQTSNAPPQLAFSDVAGPFEGVLAFCGSTTPGQKGWIFLTLPGEPESVAAFNQISGDDDPTVKIIVWDYTPWLMTTKRWWQLQGSYPAITGDPIEGSIGGNWQFTVVAAQTGIYYRASDGIRRLDWSGTARPGWEALSSLFRGQSQENVAPFYPIWAAVAREEIYFGDGAVTFALGLGPNGQYVWRMLGVPMQSCFWRQDTSEIQASFAGNVVQYEHYGALLDVAAAINLEAQTPSVLLDESRTATIQRVYVDIDCNGQSLILTILVDETETALAPITNVKRGTIELAFQAPGRRFGVRLNGSLRNRIELFKVATDIETGEPPA